jgi:hypothetical protein
MKKMGMKGNPTKATGMGTASPHNNGPTLPKASVNKDATRKGTAPTPKTLGPRSA